MPLYTAVEIFNLDKSEWLLKSSKILIGSSFCKLHIFFIVFEIVEMMIMLDLEMQKLIFCSIFKKGSWKKFNSLRIFFV